MSVIQSRCALLGFRSAVSDGQRQIQHGQIHRIEEAGRGDHCALLGIAAATLAPCFAERLDSTRDHRVAQRRSATRRCRHHRDDLSARWHGPYFLNNLFNQDAYAVMAWLMITATIVIFFNLVADIAYGWLDPRIRYD